jgi:hypothetical protein
MNLPLVPGRECGECGKCCEVLGIDTGQIHKAAGLTCQHYKEGCGCKIYETRPDVCRTFHCGWRMLPQLDDNWRPDRSNILINFQSEKIPASYTVRPGIEFLLLRPEAMDREDFAPVVVSIVEAGIPAFLALSGPKGHQPVNVFLNDFLREAIALRDMNFVIAKLHEARSTLQKHSFEPFQFKTVLQQGGWRQEQEEKQSP